MLGVLAFLAVRNNEGQLEDTVRKHLTDLYAQQNNQEQGDIINALHQNVSIY